MNCETYFSIRMKNKPFIIDSLTTWNFNQHQLYQISSRKVNNNNRTINKSDGTVMYIKQNMYDVTNIIENK